MKLNELSRTCFIHEPIGNVHRGRSRPQLVGSSHSDVSLSRSYPLQHDIARSFCQRRMPRGVVWISRWRMFPLPSLTVNSVSSPCSLLFEWRYLWRLICTSLNSRLNLCLFSPDVRIKILLNSNSPNTVSMLWLTLGSTITRTTQCVADNCQWHSTVTMSFL